jgi:hypothetical protein
MGRRPGDGDRQINAGRTWVGSFQGGLGPGISARTPRLPFLLGVGRLNQGPSDFGRHPGIAKRCPGYGAFAFQLRAATALDDQLPC